MQKIEKLKSICLQYATATQWLIPSMFTPDINTYDQMDAQKSAKAIKASRSRQVRDQATRVFNPSDEATFRTTLGSSRTEITNYALL